MLKCEASSHLKLYNLSIKNETFSIFLYLCLCLHCSGLHIEFLCLCLCLWLCQTVNHTLIISVGKNQNLFFMAMTKLFQLRVDLNA